jgi:peptide/nickel transport system substrate-binding protein
MRTIFLCVALGLSVFSIFGIAGTVGITPAQATGQQFVYGTSSGPVDWDPQYAWDSASNDVLIQIVETLWWHKLNETASTLGPKLAISYTTTPDQLNYTFTLRQGVTFHDGTPFNATAVKWNFDRLHWLMNFTTGLPAPFNGTFSLGEDYITQIRELYTTPSGDQLILKTIVVDTYTVKFVLAQPYSPFLGLLSFTGSAIMSPASTPVDHYIDITGGEYPVGTGPFKFVIQSTDDFVRLEAFDDYWGGRASLDVVYFDVISDQQTRNQAMLAKEIHMLPDPLIDMWDSGVFQADAGLHTQDGPQTLVVQYLVMNAMNMNITLRKAIAYAFNYTYEIEQIMSNTVARLHGPIPNGMQYYNGSLPYVTQDLAIARQTMVDDGMGSMAWTPTQWVSRATTNPFANLTFHYNTGNDIRRQIGELVKSNCEQIGIAVTINATTWSNLIPMYANVSGRRGELDMASLGWGPDFNDPDNYMRPLFSNTSSSNSFSINDPVLMDLMKNGTETPAANTAARAGNYSLAQDRIINTLYPAVWMHQGYNLDVWLANITGYTPNVMDTPYFYPIVCQLCRLPAAIPGFSIAMIGAVMVAGSMITILSIRKKLKL